MNISLAFLVLLVLSSPLTTQKRTTPCLHDPAATGFSGIPAPTGERSRVPPPPMGLQRSVKQQAFPPHQWGMITRRFEGGELTLARKTYSADSFYLPDTVMVYGTRDTTWHTYSYDGSGNMLTRLREDWDGTQWVNSWCYTYTYDASGNMLMWLQEDWDGAQWVNTWRYTYTYDGSGNMLTRLREDWEDTQWVHSWCYTYTYDANGNMLTWLQEDWDGSQWQRGWCYTYTYDASGKMLTFLEKDWDGTQWVNDVHMTNTYDTSGNVLMSIVEEWDGTQWVNDIRRTYTYDASGNILTALREQWVVTEWVNDWRYTYTYDAGGNELTGLREDWDGTQWVNSWRYSYTYDASGNVLMWLQEDWKGTQWVNDARSTYTYNANGNMSVFNGESWSGSTWVPGDGSLNVLTEKNSYNFNGYKINLSYIEITTSYVAQQEESAMSYHLAQNYPNPFNPTTSIEYTLPHSGYVTLRVYNVLGEEVETLLSEQSDPGFFTVLWDASGLPSGVYFYRLNAGEYVQTRKMVLMR